jgi:hypothetical protein
MSKAAKTPQESGLLGRMTGSEETEAPQMETEQAGSAAQARQHRPHLKGGRPKESKVHRLSHGQELYTPKKRERNTPALLTVDQYLRKTKQDNGISGLIRSLHNTRVMSFEEWEREAAALLKKKTW